jgi:serine protease AprX
MPKRRAGSRGEPAPEEINPPAGQGAPLPIFRSQTLDKSVIAIPLLERMGTSVPKTGQLGSEDLLEVIIDPNLDFHMGRDAAREQIQRMLGDVRGGPNRPRDPATSRQYLFESLTAEQIRQLVRLDVKGKHRAIYRIWPDFKVRPLLIKSAMTVKADAARTAFGALGKGIVWAVIDSGIDEHKHFTMHGNLDVAMPVEHKSFLENDSDPLEDAFGHGTHVAGIIAGELKARGPGETSGEAEAFRVDEIPILTRHRDEDNATSIKSDVVPQISGIAPKCRIVSYKVLNADGEGNARAMIAALEEVQRVNGEGRRIRIHGVNLSVGYDFDPEWFACGQSPLCIEVNRLVRSGVVVVVAAGNTGFAYAQSVDGRVMASGKNLSINDPGNAELAITVGSTHRDMPHMYGVSYFSSKGPTGDGRPKPDLLAPGEKILSCAAGKKLQEARDAGHEGLYLEESGTSMAAPHVSGVIAAFLSVRPEFKERPEKVKEIFVSTATDLKRERSFQGHGLVDLMRAIQSV